MERTFSSELKPRVWSVLQILVLLCNKEGECFPDVETIAARHSYGMPTVKWALDELVKAEYIVDSGSLDKCKNSDQISNSYIPYTLTCTALISRKTGVAEDRVLDELPVAQLESAFGGYLYQT